MSQILLRHDASADALIACTLTPDEYRERTSTLSALAAGSLLERTPIRGGQRLTFVDTPAVEQELRAAVAAEASCCSFLTLDLRRVDGGLELDVTGGARAQPIITELFASR